MNITLVFLLLMGLSFFVWHSQLIRREEQIHSVLISDLEFEINLQKNKQITLSKESRVKGYEVINLKLSILKEQVDLLTVISNQNQ